MYPFQGEAFMRLSRLFFRSLREDPQEAETQAHRWLLRANFMTKSASGVYTFLPLGLRVLKKIEEIIRQEMDALGAQEIVMPVLIPRTLWEETGRWQLYGKELMRIKDRHNREFALGPTHEEMVTHLVRTQVTSYRSLPLILYQIQTKFRDEMRPRFGLMRAREFLMKDAYSFEPDGESLNETYQKIYSAYCRIFQRCGLEVKAVEATTGAIGGDVSHEFMVPAENGEDTIFLCDHCDYAASEEKAESLARPFNERNHAEAEAVKTPGISSVQEVAAFFKAEPHRLIKTIIVSTEKGCMAALLRGDRSLNEEKLKKAAGVKELKMATAEEIERATGASVGFSGPVGISVPLICDEEVKGIQGGITGANRNDFHLKQVNAGRDFPVRCVADLRIAVDGDGCARCGTGKLRATRGIEVGHIFKLGTKYSQAMNLTVKDEKGNDLVVIMGCYGIGVSRLISAIAETRCDQSGLRFNAETAPYTVHLICVNQQDKKMREAAEKLYAQFLKVTDVLYDDRDERAGVKFKDADLIGSFCQVIVGKKIEEGKVELKNRWTGTREDVSLEEVMVRLKAKINVRRGNGKDP